MSELKIGSTVEHLYSERALTVRIVGAKQVVVQAENGELEVLPPEELFVVPDDAYCRLRRTVIDTMDKVTSQVGRNNINSARYQLAVARALYESDVRRGDDDLVQKLQKDIKAAVIGSISSEAVSNIMRQTENRIEIETGNDRIVLENLKSHTLARTESGSHVYSAEALTEKTATLQHTDLTGHSEALVQQLTDDELALMCCDVADMLAGSIGFQASYVRGSKKEGPMSSLQIRVTYWAGPRGNLRKQQTWELAKKVVGHCRMAEVDDAIEGVLEAIRQQEDMDEEESL